MGFFSDYLNHELPPFWRCRSSHYKPEIPDCPRISMDLPSVWNITGIPEVTWMLSNDTGPVAVYFGNLYVQSSPTKLSTFFILFLSTSFLWVNAVGIATGYWLDGRGVGVRVLVASRIFTSPCRPDRLWGRTNCLSNGYRVLFLRG
jgi:hypothetical protein